jgi:protein-disulfide isomerase
MRKYFVITLAVLTFTSLGVAYAQQAATPAAPATPIAAQNAPAQAEKPDPTIKESGNTGGVVRSYLIQDAPLRNDYVLGKKDAPVVMVEYASLSCPHCAHFSNTVLPELEKKYINTGKLAYVLRQFPLNEPAMRAAMLVDCVGSSSEEQYYVFSRVLFDAQNRWAFDSNFMEGLETIAGVGGISKAQFKNCVSDKDREMKLLKQKKTDNDELKIPHTPYIVIGGEAYTGDRNVVEVSKFIDAKLAKAKK